MAYNYTFWSAADTKISGLRLHVINAPAADVAPRHLNPPVNVTDQSLAGINGSFFMVEKGVYGLLSISVVDGKPLNGQPGEYASGWFNIGDQHINHKKGTMVFDKVTQRVSVQIVSSADEIVVNNKSSYWAQGGHSMSMSNDSGWKAQAQAEHMPAIDASTKRSGMCFHTQNGVDRILLIVTEDNCTAGNFRQAIKNVFGAVPGIFLDGGGSSQMKCQTGTGVLNIAGDGRKVPEMLRVF